jgi:DNA-binding IclR family transcriptional regulator
VLDAIGWIPTSLAELADHVPLGVDRLVDMLTELERAGWLASRDHWFERVAEP